MLDLVAYKKRNISVNVNINKRKCYFENFVNILNECTTFLEKLKTEAFLSNATSLKKTLTD